MMFQYGHESAIATDATLATNDKKFLLFMMMVFDEWQSGVPVAFVITVRQRQSNLAPWMHEVKAKMMAAKADWHLNAFVLDDADNEINSLREVWPGVELFLCL